MKQLVKEDEYPKSCVDISKLTGWHTSHQEVKRDEKNT